MDESQNKYAELKMPNKLRTYCKILCKTGENAHIYTPERRSILIILGLPFHEHSMSLNLFRSLILLDNAL